MSERPEVRQPYGAAEVVDVETTTVVVPLGADDGEDAEDTTHLREEIEQTRAELSDTINAIQDRLNPQNLMEQAKETARDTATDMVAQAKETVREATIGKAEQMVSNVGDTARGTGSSIIGTIKQNPLPAALVAVGVGWLWMNRTPGTTGDASSPSYDTGYRFAGTSPAASASFNRGGSAYVGAESRYGTDGTSSTVDGHGDLPGMMDKTVDQVQNTASQLAAQAQSGAGAIMEGTQQLAAQAQSGVGTVVEGTQQRARQAQGQAQQMLQDTPLAVGGIALALGAAVGLALPETPLERSLMGEARDTLVQRAQEAAQESMQKVGSVAQAVTSSAVDAAKTEAQQQGLTS